MQSIILAAGMGKRLKKYTKDGTKCMVPVNGKPIIDYTLESLSKAGIKKITVVIGYKGEKLKNYIKDKYPYLEINFIENPVYDKTNNIYSLFLAKDVLVEDDTILLESDLVFKPEIISDLVNSCEENLAVLSPFESWMDGTVALIDGENNISGLIGKENFNWENKNEYYKTVNIYKFSKDFSRKYYIPFLQAYIESYGKNEYYEQVLKVIAFLDSTNLKAHIVDGRNWYEIDDGADLSIAESRFAPPEKKREKMQKRYGGYWRFPEILDFCYLVNPYFPPKTLVEELKNNFDMLLTQYPSGAAEQSLLAGKIFNIPEENVIVGNGAAELISALSVYTGKKILVPYPTFNEYSERFAKVSGDDSVVRINTSENAFEYSDKEILRCLEKNPGVKTVLLINPDNPSGNFIHKKQVLDLLTELDKRNIVLIFDESFIDFAEENIKYTLIDDEILCKFNNLIVVKSISKSYGVPGIRLGILASGNTELIARLKKEIPIWNINSLGENFLQIYEKYSKKYSEACLKIARERQRFSGLLSALKGVKVYKSQANYLLCRLDCLKATELTDILLSRYNIFIKDLSAKAGFPKGEFVRIAVRNRADNDRLLTAMKDILSNLE